MEQYRRGRHLRAAHGFPDPPNLNHQSLKISKEGRNRMNQNQASSFSWKEERRMEENLT